MKIAIVITVLAASCFSVLAQDPDTLWTAMHGPLDRNDPEGVIQCPDLGFVIVGSSNYYNGPAQIWILKTDTSGLLVWEKLLGDSLGDYGEAVLNTEDGCYHISAITYTPEQDGANISFLKLNDSGDIVWEREFNEFEENWVRDSRNTSDGGFISVGSCGSYLTNMDGLLLKTDSTGNTEWFRTFDYGEEEFFEVVAQTSDGGYIIGGREKVFGGQADAYIVKTDSNGITEWETVLGNADYERPKSIFQTQDGGYIVLVTKTLSTDTNVSWLIKLDSYGDVEWDIQSSPGEPVAYSLLLAQDGGFHMTGIGSGELWLCKVDNLGAIEWDTSVGTYASTFGKFFQQTTDEGFIVTSKVQPGSGMMDLWLVRFAPKVGISGEEEPNPTVRLISNPGAGGIRLLIDEAPLDAAVIDITGRVIHRIQQTEPTTLYVPLPAGVYHIVDQNHPYQILRAVVLPE
ncbi:MAG: T9SS type A sorting domain-containing protein [Candidatus Aegiribacteria sp.]|nr:T9SS type A sorting domain-containing protein [Candidatus Aegiribacteria sp.]